MIRKFAVACFSLFVFSACSDNVKTEPYYTAYRQFPPEPVYSRVTWSHLPMPVQPRTHEEAPYLMPEIYFDMPNSNLGESVEAIAQTMGYQWECPQAIAKKPVRIRMNGTIKEVLDEIDRQAGVKTTMDHQKRSIHVGARQTRATLP